ncbi:aprataxin and PNK-like factor [Triplophysa rosa]|uniref:Aprataxin and PNK-like factor n=1 Tax=Triplophysa rosa TaxID=992332 RepID=A0A9W7WZ48_TRIRA|nr:aprataxin and PNK-like factor [Triplophysa rosa]KAI7810849.1 putative aprataxin and PNK-like factor [Triplophysa rosa]
MPGFELEQVDGGPPIDLPYGETVLGRGPFLGVSDMRVSRNHGVLENQKGDLRLKPTHLNPCFIQTSIVATPQPLEKDVWHYLREGDIFSLMPGRYIYRVHVKQDDRTPRNSRGFEEEMDMKECLPRPAEPCEDSATLEGENDVPVTQNSTLTGSEKQGGSAPPVSSLNESPAMCQKSEPSLPQKKRVLPDWMIACGSATQSPSAAKGESKAVRGTLKQSKRPAARKLAPEPKRARTAQVSSEEEGKPRRKAKRLKSDSEDELGDATALKSTRVGSVKDGPSNESDSTGLMERDNGKKGGGIRGASAQSEDSQTQAKDSSNLQVDQGPSQNTQQTSKITESKSKTSTSKVKKQSRTPCPYGSFCYRKNPVHFQECNHPGDSDYEEEKTEDGDDERPKCPYGTHCYRKNPLHKKEYKHTKSPPKSSADDEDEDQYQNSFINDESEEEEVGDDSDYVPETDDSRKEDIKCLQKEAQAFLRRKK